MDIPVGEVIVDSIKPFINLLGVKRIRKPHPVRSSEPVALVGDDTVVLKKIIDEIIGVFDFRKHVECSLRLP